MKDKVVRKHNSSSITPSNDEHTIPSNILISHSQSISSSLSASTISISSSSFNQQSSTASQTAFISSNINPSFVSSNEAISLTLPLPVQQVLIDDDTPLPLHAASYVDLQSCPINLTLPSSPPKRTSLVDEEETKNSSNSIDTCKISLVFH